MVVVVASGCTFAPSRTIRLGKEIAVGGTSCAVAPRTRMLLPVYVATSLGVMAWMRLSTTMSTATRSIGVAMVTSCVGSASLMTALNVNGVPADGVVTLAVAV